MRVVDGDLEFLFFSLGFLLLEVWVSHCLLVLSTLRLHITQSLGWGLGWNRINKRKKKNQKHLDTSSVLEKRLFSFLSHSLTNGLWWSFWDLFVSNFSSLLSYFQNQKVPLPASGTGFWHWSQSVVSPLTLWGTLDKWLHLCFPLKWCKMHPSQTILKIRWGEKVPDFWLTHAPSVLNCTVKTEG